MENKNEKIVTLLNGLIEINNDRIKGYEKAANEVEESDLRMLFTEFATESRKYRGELISEVVSNGGTPAEGTTTVGKFYHAWMDIKAAVTGKDTKAIISSCEFGEDAAMEAYDDALKSEDINTSVSAVVSAQRNRIKDAHNKIKMLRDTADVHK